MIIVRYINCLKCILCILLFFSENNNKDSVNNKKKLFSLICNSDSDKGIKDERITI